MITRIRAVRKALKLSQKAFGAKLGVSRDVVGNIEYGRVPPKEPFVALLCHQYKVNRSWLETGEGDMFVKVPPKDMASEAREIFSALRPELQDFALDQMRKLAELQKKGK